MKNQIADTFVNIFISLVGALIITFLSLCFPRKLIDLPALPVFTDNPFLEGQFSYIQLLGFIPIILGALMILWCYWHFVFHGKGTPVHFKPPKRVVIKGLYRFVRNPMLIGFDLIWVGNSIFYQSLKLFLYTVIVHGFFIFLVLIEEQMLESRFGDSYKRYCDNVPRWIPRLTPYRKNSQ